MAGAGSSAPPSRSLGVRLAGALLAMLVPTVVLGVVGIAVLVKSNEAASTLHDEVVDEAQVMGELRTQLRTAALDVERALVLHDPAGSARFAEKSRRVDELFSGIENFDGASEKQAASKAREAWLRARAMGQALFDTPGGGPAPSLEALVGFHQETENTLVQVSRAEKIALDEIIAERSVIDEDVRWLTALLVMGVVGGLAGALALARRLHKSIHGPLQALEEGARHIGADDLAHRVQVRAADEVGTVAHAFNAMAERLAAIRRQLEHQAFHDALTGLANRMLVEDRINHALDVRRRSGAELGVLIMDLDGFKSVNDTLGHQAGDKLLAMLAERFQACLRPSDTAARLGGDEFAFLIEGLPRAEEPDIVAARLMSEVARPLLVEGREIMMSASVGSCAVAHGDSAGELLRNADVAMYEPRKQAGVDTEPLSPPCTTRWHGAWAWSPSCARRWPKDSSPSTTSPSCAWLRTASPEWRPSCAGTTHSGALCFPPSSSNWRSRRA